jgi:hypothetical protein
MATLRRSPSFCTVSPSFLPTRLPISPSLRHRPAGGLLRGTMAASLFLFTVAGSLGFRLGTMA